MPTRSTKGGKKSSAAKKSTKKKKKGSAPGPTAGSDPPIIVDGGSVTISSMIAATTLPSTDPLYPFVYRFDVDITEMDWSGQNNRKDKTKGGKNFKLKLFS